MIESILIILSGILDRIRGGFPSIGVWPSKPSWVDKFRELGKYLYGMVLASLITSNPILILAAGMTWKFGEQFSNPWGSWSDQFKIYWGLPGSWKAVVRTGFFWPILTLPLMYWEFNFLYLLMASVIASPLALFLAIHTPFKTKFLELKSQPAWQDIYRGVLIGALFYLFNLYS